MKVAETVVRVDTIYTSTVKETTNIQAYNLLFTHGEEVHINVTYTELCKSGTPLYIF